MPSQPFSLADDPQSMAFRLRPSVIFLVFINGHRKVLVLSIDAKINYTFYGMGLEMLHVGVESK